MDVFEKFQDAVARRDADDVKSILASTTGTTGANLVLETITPHCKNVVENSDIDWMLNEIY